MKAKSFLPLPITTLVLGIISVGEITVASEPIFHCQLDRDTPTTVAKTSNGAEKSVFHWNLDRATTQAKPEQLCNSVTQKLNKYLSQGNELSSLTFKGSVVSNDDESAMLPAVCVAGEEKPCQLLLFTLQSSEQPEVVASDALTSILDKNLQDDPVRSPTRGVQSTAYKVNFWELLGW